MRKVLYILGALAGLIFIACLVKHQTASRRVSFKDVKVIKHSSDNDKQVRVVKNGKWGMTDRTGKILGEIEYDSISTFSEGFSVVAKNGKYGYVDEEFNFIVEPKYDFGNYFVNGFAIVRHNKKDGFINKEGEEIIKPNYYDYISNFDRDGHAIAESYAEGKKHIIDTNGKIVKDLTVKK